MKLWNCCKQITPKQKLLVLALLQGPKKPIQNVVLDDIHEEFVLKDTIKKKMDVDQLGLDADNVRRIST